MSRTSDHGTAVLYTDGGFDLAGGFDPRGAMAVLLGTDKDRSRGSAWLPANQQGHGLTFGATRSGKGVSAIIPALLTYEGSMVVIDPKGENAWVTAERRRQLGQRVVILDPWGEVNRRYAGGQPVETTTRFNPLSAIDPDGLDFSDEVTAIAEALIIDTHQESHWNDSARELVGGLVAAVIEQQPGKASLGAVRDLLTRPNEELAEILDTIIAERPDSLAARKLRRFLRESNEIASIRSTAETQTAVLDNKTLQVAMETDEPPFDLTELATGRVTLYLVLPLDRLQSHGRWLRLILTLAIRAISRQAQPPAIPVMFLLDEFGTIGKLAMIEQAFGLMAGIGIRVWAFLQDINQLKRDYPQSWETFIANCAIIQVLNARDTTTSNYFSDYLGNRTLEYISSETAKVRQGGVILPGEPEHWKLTDQYVPRPLMFPEELRRLDPSVVLVFQVGVRAVAQYRLVYHSEPRFAGMFRHLPAFPPQPPAEPEPVKKKGWFG